MKTRRRRIQDMTLIETRDIATADRIRRHRPRARHAFVWNFKNLYTIGAYLHLTKGAEFNFSTNDKAARLMRIIEQF